MNHVVVIDLGYGDAGKGAVVDNLCATEDVATVVRFNGGCQAAHNVITDDNRHHTFAQFGSGTLQGVPTFLSKYVLVEPLSLLIEAEHLASLGVKNPLRMVSISENALLTTPYHWELNQWAERQRGGEAHGTVGRGIGATAEYALLAPTVAPRAKDLRKLSQLGVKLQALEQWVAVLTGGEVFIPHADVIERYRDLDRLLKIVPDSRLKGFLDSGLCVFEGAQGVLLDEDYGFHPHTTWSHTTDRNARELLTEHEQQDPHVIGVTRSYMTRHGAGPFVTEIKDEDSSPSYVGVTLRVAEKHNDASGWAGQWRVGHADLAALRYAVSVCQGIDSLVVTHTDTLGITVHRYPPTYPLLCTQYLDASGDAVKIEKLPVDDFDSRARQTEAMKSWLPAYEAVTVGASGFPYYLAECLDIPLSGIRFGSHTSDQRRPMYIPKGS